MVIGSIFLYSAPAKTAAIALPTAKADDDKEYMLKEKVSDEMNEDSEEGSSD